MGTLSLDNCIEKNSGLVVFDEMLVVRVSTVFTDHGFSSKLFFEGGERLFG
jgi:hypothetical protein